jgi:hypothetical protein
MAAATNAEANPLATAHFYRTASREKHPQDDAVDQVDHHEGHCGLSSSGPF